MKNFSQVKEVSKNDRKVNLVAKKRTTKLGKMLKMAGLATAVQTVVSIKTDTEKDAEMADLDVGIKRRAVETPIQPHNVLGDVTQAYNNKAWTEEEKNSIRNGLYEFVFIKSTQQLKDRPFVGPSPEDQRNAVEQVKVLLEELEFCVDTEHRLRNFDIKDRRKFLKELRDVFQQEQAALKSKSRQGSMANFHYDDEVISMQRRHVVARNNLLKKAVLKHAGQKLAVNRAAEHEARSDELKAFQSDLKTINGHLQKTVEKLQEYQQDRQFWKHLLTTLKNEETDAHHVWALFQEVEHVKDLLGNFKQIDAQLSKHKETLEQHAIELKQSFQQWQGVDNFVLLQKVIEQNKDQHSLHEYMLEYVALISKHNHYRSMIDDFKETNLLWSFIQKQQALWDAYELETIQIPKSLYGFAKENVERLRRLGDEVVEDMEHLSNSINSEKKKLRNAQSQRVISNGLQIILKHENEMAKLREEFNTDFSLKEYEADPEFWNYYLNRLPVGGALHGPQRNENETIGDDLRGFFDEAVKEVTDQDVLKRYGQIVEEHKVIVDDMKQDFSQNFRDGWTIGEKRMQSFDLNTDSYKTHELPQTPQKKKRPN